MPIRGEVRTEKPPSSRASVKPRDSAKTLRAIDVSEWTLRFAVLALIVALPWYYGSVHWSSQYALGWAGVALSGAVVLHCFVSLLNKSGDLGVPWLTWVFIGLGLVAWIQSRPAFTWQGTELAPPSIQMQRWALGLSGAPSAAQTSLLKTELPNNADSSPGEVPCDLNSVPESERTLAWSIEPLHTRGAAMSLFLCGLFVWIGRIVFSDSHQQLWLFGTLTLTGILISCVGIQGAISYNTLNFLGLKTGSSFATFFSKNSAGGFYNICIAGCLGLLGWTLLNTRRSSKDIRYRFTDRSITSRLRGFAEDTLSELNTAQIAAILCLIGIVFALLISQCRGAAVSALGAILLAAKVANSKDSSRGNWAIAVAVVTIFVTSMIVFQVDEKAYDRLESLSEIDIESELRQGRAYIWSIAWKSMAFYGWLGSGLGTFHFAYLPFQQPSSTGWFYHAESLYAQCGVELGYLGLSVLIIAIAVLLSNLQKAPAKENWGVAFPSKLAGTYLVISQSLHSFVDFAIILPALFVPACILVGSVQGALFNAQIATVRKRSRSDSKEPTKALASKNTNWLRNGVLGIAVATGCGATIVSLLESVKSLALSDELVDFSKKEEKKYLEVQSPDRVIEMAKIWARDTVPLKENSIAMGAFADSLQFDYRMNQMIATRPVGAWSQYWGNTSPVMIQVALNKAQDQIKKDQIIESVGGGKAMEILGGAANWYALGQTKSPLDWRLLWGRCLTNTQCDRSERARLLQPSLTLAQHNAQQLLAAAVIYRDNIDQSQFEAVLAQAMKSNPGSSMNAAKLLALERKDNEVAITLFPQRYDILQAIASETFTKVRFPETYRLLWEKAAELIALAPMTRSRREIWLADCATALDDVDKEIKHLQIAIMHERNDLKLHLRLANRLIEIGDVEGASKVLLALQRLAPKNREVIAIADRVSEI
ncbi:MAG: O-antigen ligase family protein [Planctomycetota bacterium]|nr:O-antigen ligase family protein [Planctomycetota bacterium]